MILRLFSKKVNIRIDSCDMCSGRVRLIVMNKSRFSQLKKDYGNFERSNYRTPSQNGHSSPQSGVPTKEEISKVMEAVNDVFDGLKEMCIGELEATDEAVSIEVEKLADRAKETLDLIEEMSLLKLTCLVSENTLCTSDSKTKIQKIVTEGDRFLDRCISQAGSEIRNSSSQFVAETNKAVSKGHAILDSLDDCMQKTGFQQFSCYRKVMNNDVEPLTGTLLETIR
ncbi:uncharacterized protein LOC108736627 [Agrilus planipennis]|uniref:Uncharacterized protein LOC108736627 n=1 Tax=Agrilus planipennis TaxID=224129 RepID=A0A7F5QXL7_AGRPL|nr:uncharacterized protein LOC108736627 [Agrilus planipennis]